MSEKVPVLSVPSNPRFLKLKSDFRAHYGCDLEFFVRVPGRVNLIGEHIDYCGYGVCPMALEQDILLGVATEADGVLHLTNSDPIYKPYECSKEDISIKVSEGAPEWYQYFLCGVRGILDHASDKSGLKELKGLKVMVSGTIPQSAGLSSSSALVSAAALATAHANNVELSKEEIADICAKCERYIGTQGGGMDQAIAFLATKGCAKLINFNPLKSKDVSLPEGAVFVIAHSLTRLNKAATADFNCRVVECRIAAQILSKKSGLDWKSIKRLGELQNTLKVDLDSMIQLVIKNLHEEVYSKEEILKELQATEEELNSFALTENTRHIRNFKLRQRALHVFQEALRVENFHATCSNASGEGALQVLGKLMSESHASLRDLYECSHPQLDGLVELSRELTYGARLTGAGWGGCAVILVKPGKVDEYLATLKETFYKKLGAADQHEALIFATEPNQGACIYV